LAGITLLELLTGLTVEADKDEVESVCLVVEVMDNLSAHKGHKVRELIE